MVTFLYGAVLAVWGCLGFFVAALSFPSINDTMLGKMMKWITARPEPAHPVLKLLLRGLIALALVATMIVWGMAWPISLPIERIVYARRRRGQKRA